MALSTLLIALIALSTLLQCYNCAYYTDLMALSTLLQCYNSAYYTIPMLKLRLLHYYTDIMALSTPITLI